MPQAAELKPDDRTEDVDEAELADLLPPGEAVRLLGLLEDLGSPDTWVRVFCRSARLSGVSLPPRLQAQ